MGQIVTRWAYQNKIILSAAVSDITTGLKGYWLADAGAANGGILVDTSGNGHNLSGLSDSYWQTGYYDFTSTIAHVADHADFAPTSNALAFFGWIKGSSQIGSVLASQQNTDASDWSWMLHFGVGLTDKFRVHISDDGTSSAGHYKAVHSSDAVLDNTWHSVGFCFNAGTLKLYRDGVHDASAVEEVGSSAITAIFNSTDDFAIGGAYNGGLEYAYCTLSGQRFRFYNIAKTDADFAAMHAVGHA